MGGRASLFIVLGFGAVLAIFQAQFNWVTRSAVDNLISYTMATSSHDLAVAGANVGLAIAYQNTFSGGNLSPSTVSTQSFTSGAWKGGSFTVVLDSINPLSKRLTSVSTLSILNSLRMSGTDSLRLHDTVKVWLTAVTSSDFTFYGYMSNFGGNDEFWVHLDTMDCPSRFNGRIHVNGDPVFTGKVLTSKNFDPRVHTGVNNAVLKKGYETGISPIAFPTDPTAIVTHCLTGGKLSKSGGGGWKNSVKAYYDTALVDGPLYLDFMGPTGTSSGGHGANDGRVVAHRGDWTNASLIDTFYTNSTGAASNCYQEFYSLHDIHIRGMVKDKISLYTLGNLVIEDNVTYTSPNINGLNDMLGAYAHSNIIIADNAATHGSLVLYGVFVAMTGSTIAENLNGRGKNGTLYSFGALINWGRANIANYNASAVNTGFQKHFYFDNRLSKKSNLPVDFPGATNASRFVITGWWENVRILN